MIEGLVGFIQSRSIRPPQVIQSSCDAAETGICYRPAMPDRLFSDPRLASLYDSFAPSEKRDDFRFYLPLVMSAASVLDVGCGTGSFLHMAREAGHSGRLCGLDPAPGMLEQARRRMDIEWILGDLTSVSWEDEFDLIVMTGHAFQVLIDEDEILAALVAIRTALATDGKFAFETRNPLVREWERWTTENVVEVTEPSGAVVRMERQVEQPVEGDVVRFSHTFTRTGWQRPEMSRSVLRFLNVDSLSSFLFDAGLAIEEQFGHWDRSPVTAESPEIITIARRG